MPDGPRLPGVDHEDDEDRIVCHVDADCFYASCERLREPELEDDPVVVGMGYEPGETIGAVATASYEAREFGVESAQAISSALERLPRRAALDPDATTTIQTSRARTLATTARSIWTFTSPSLTTSGKSCTTAPISFARLASTRPT